MKPISVARPASEIGFELEMPKEKIPKELIPGNFPEKITWPKGGW